MESLQVHTIKTVFYNLNRGDKQSLLNQSNLTTREVKILTFRLVDGLSVKETAGNLNLEIDTYNKAYHKAMVKLYKWLNRKAEQKGIELNQLLIGEN